MSKKSTFGTMSIMITLKLDVLRVIPKVPFGIMLNMIILKIIMFVIIDLSIIWLYVNYYCFETTIF